MSTSQLLKIKNNGESSLFKTRSANMLISGWLSEMDGENTEEDREIYVNHPKLDGSISSISLKKVFKNSPDTIPY